MNARRSRHPLSVLPRLRRDEDGAVMVLTLVVMLMLVKVAMSTYNVGVLTSQKIRLQTVADAAAYSSAVWQARFLNYCAYTRRAMIANAANMNTIAASKTNAEAIKMHCEEKYTVTPLALANIGCEILSSLVDKVPDALEHLLDGALDEACRRIGDFVGSFAWEIQDDEPLYGMPRMATWSHHNIGYLAIRPVQAPAVSSADHLNYMLGESQKALYFYVSQPWFTTAHEVVQVANGHGIQNYTPLPIEVSPFYEVWGAGTFAAAAPGMLNSSFLEQRDLRSLARDIELRSDGFTMADANLDGVATRSVIGSLGFGRGAEFFGWVMDALGGDSPLAKSLPFFASRPYWGFDLVWLGEYLFSDWPAGEPKVIYLNTRAEPVTTNFSSDNPIITAIDGKKIGNGGRVSSTSLQYYGWIYIPGNIPIISHIRLPLIIPFSGLPEIPRYTYEYVHRAQDVNYYDLRNLEPEQYEPSVYVALRIKRDDFVGKNETGDGILFHNRLLPVADTVRTMHAVSRAKVYFQPRYSGRGMEYYAPNLYYPYWEAQLAPYWGAGYGNSTASIDRNGKLLLLAVLGDVLVEENALAKRRGSDTLDGIGAARLYDFHRSTQRIRY